MNLFSWLMRKFFGDAYDLMFFKVALDSIRDSIVFVNKEGVITFTNDSFWELLKCEGAEDVLQTSFSEWLAEPLDSSFNFYNFDEKEGTKTYDLALRGSSNKLVLTKAKILKVNGLNIIVLEDQLKQKEREISLIREVKTDKLTGLFNRKGFEERLSVAINKDELERNYRAGVLFIDLDAFKPVNDTYGHDVGDLLLINVAQNILSTLEDFETAARIGGDEFVCILPLCESESDLRARAKQILEAVAKPVVVNDINLNVKCSIGGALCVTGDTEQSLLKRADVAMYSAKKSGKNQICIGA